MPREARNQEEIDRVKDSILTSALDIIVEEGYDGFTMRKLGRRLGWAAKTIYNYFSSKEEIYLRLLMKGFEILNNSADETIDGVTDPREKLRRLSANYIQFGLKNTQYYDLMFSWDVPKYLSYANTILEPIAREEKETALYYISLAEEALSEILSEKKAADKEEVAFHLVRMWSELHGFVSLHNSFSFREYRSDTLEFRERIVESMLAALVP